VDRRSQELQEDRLVQEVLVEVPEQEEVVVVVDNTAWKLKNTFNKLTSVFFYASVLLLMINCVITLSKWLRNHEPDINLRFTIT